MQLSAATQLPASGEFTINYICLKFKVMDILYEMVNCSGHSLY